MLVEIDLHYHVFFGVIFHFTIVGTKYRCFGHGKTSPTGSAIYSTALKGRRAQRFATKDYPGLLL